MNETKNIQTEQEIVREVQEDFKNRQMQRKSYEAQWQLNMNFLMGNQYCTIGINGEVEDYDKQYLWQEKEVYNHIAPIIDARLAKLSRLKPLMTVVPASGDERDIKTAKLSKKIVNSVYNQLAVNGTISEATKWSETCGTSFYKIVWNGSAGKNLGKNGNGEDIKTGEIDISVCSPFEIFPESSSSTSINDCKSIIHARAYHIDVIKNLWGVDVVGEDINVYSLDVSQSLGGVGYTGNATKIVNATRSNYAVVIERYEAPSFEYPNGRLIIVAGDKLVHISELPYINGNKNERVFPFIKQTCIEHPGCFWGSSIIERLIPIQRSFNTIKNRKHEFMNRLSMGVLTVEDGSVDTDNLEDEGLSPGKILVYRQGSNPPSFMNFGSVPIDFSYEEEKLINEFTLISGVSDLMVNSTRSLANMSGVAIQLLVDQDDTRISVTADSIREAIKTLGKHVLRLYKQFATIPRLEKIVGDNGEIEIFYFNSSDISSDDIVFETENEIGDTVAQRRNMVFELLKVGLLHDENGQLSNRMRVKVLDLLGFGVWENAQDINELHLKKATSENIKMFKDKKCLNPLEIDEHEVHVSEHTSFMLSREFQNEAEKNPELVDVFLKHIRKHKQMNKIETQLQSVEE